MFTLYFSDVVLVVSSEKAFLSRINDMAGGLAITWY